MKTNAATSGKCSCPDCVRESLADSYAFYLDMANKGVRGPSAKELRMTAALNSLLGKDED